MKSHSAKSTPKKTVARSTLGRVAISCPRIRHLRGTLDLAGRSRRALRYAVRIAQKFSARIILFHALVPTGVRAQSLVSIGHPGLEILAAADREKVDLTVISPQGKSGLKRILLGSAAEPVTREVFCPVLSWCGAPGGFPYCAAW